MLEGAHSLGQFEDRNAHHPGRQNRQDLVGQEDHPAIIKGNALHIQQGITLLELAGGARHQKTRPAKSDQAKQAIEKGEGENQENQRCWSAIDDAHMIRFRGKGGIFLWVIGKMVEMRLWVPVTHAGNGSNGHGLSTPITPECAANQGVDMSFLFSHRSSSPLKT